MRNTWAGRVVSSLKSPFVTTVLIFLQLFFDDPSERKISITEVYIFLHTQKAEPTCLRFYLVVLDRRKEQKRKLNSFELRVILNSRMSVLMGTGGPY